MMGRPATTDTAVPAPNSTMPSGDIIASAVRLEKNRSRKLSVAIGRDQKLEITAVNTLSMVAGLLES